MSLGNDDLESRLWSIVPRGKQELSFPQIKALADFFAKIVDYKSPFTSTHSIGVASALKSLCPLHGI